MTDNNIAELARVGTGRLAVDFFSPPVRLSEFDRGRALMLEAIVSGGDPSLALLLARGVDTIRGGTDQAAGAIALAVEAFDKLAAVGRPLKVAEVPGHPGVARALQATGEMRRALLCVTPEADYAATLQTICAAVRACAPLLTRAEPAPAAPQPLPVQIVGMPSTRSVQTVERDADQEIVQTVTTTAPLAAPA